MEHRVYGSTEGERWGSPCFLALNYSRRSVTLDLETEMDKEILSELVKKADVVAENQGSGNLRREGVV
ncbi:MAG: CoA transferase [Dehalococcoidia bacterium]